MSNSIKFTGIQCDAEDCNYVDQYVKREDYESFIDKPCPLCGSNLLTNEDWHAVLVLEAIGNWLDVVRPKGAKTKTVPVVIKWDGTGFPEIMEIDSD